MTTRTWFHSQLNHSTQIYMELTLGSDGMPIEEPKLLAFLNTKGRPVACLFSPHPVELEVKNTTTVLQAKQIVENALKS